ncbi:MAG TPA: hypothetical protein VMX33_06525 [bacterium]|nr:hypothetical protein [bacterium]
MIASSCKYESLASKESFNASVRHVKATVSLSERVSNGENLADILNAMIDDKSINADEVQPLVSMLLIDKFHYYTSSKNLASTANDLMGVHESVKGWNAYDIVILYYHPDVGVMAINPKNKFHVSRIDRMNKSELLVVYAGAFGKPVDEVLAARLAESLMGLYEGRKVKEAAALLKGSCAYRPAAEPKVEKPAKAPRAAAKPTTPKAKGKASAKSATGKAAVASAAPLAKPVVAPKTGSRMTPMYGVNVTNELFHNGNVEAWKRIIDSFKVKHPDLDVLVYYDGERIVNLNALFKWGKVKHGSVIQFAVAGENICDVAKLQRYLSQGASPMFEAFLRGPVNGVLSLF